MADRADRFPPPTQPRSGTIADDRGRRLRLLDATLAHWLHDAGRSPADPAGQAAGFSPILAQWLHEVPPENPGERLEQLAERLRARMRAPAPSVEAFIGAFAHGLIAQAVDDVEREARRAGHADVFAGLRPWLHREPADADLEALGARLRVAASTLAFALSRLRRRLRQRMDGELALWASSPESRNTLRKRLHASVLGEEPSP
jgi:hypothetical protein